MKTLLIINPNTSQTVTQLIHQHVQAKLGTQWRLASVTAPFGAPYISDEVSYAVAGHAVLEAYSAAAKTTQIDGVLIACFGDPGLFALRELAGADVPVLGLAEAAFIEAAAFGPFAVVTGGAKWAPMLTRLAQNLGYAERIAGIQTVHATGAELAANPAAACDILAEACNAALANWPVQSIIVGGAGLAGFARQIADRVPVNLIDSVAAGARQLAALVEP